MKKLVLFFGLFYYIFFSTKNYSSENKDKFTIEIIGYNETFDFDEETDNFDKETKKKLKCDFIYSVVTKIEELNLALIGPGYGNPSIKIVIIKVANKNEVEEFKNDFETFFDNFIKTNEATEKKANTEINNREFYFVFIDKNDINYDKSQKGMNNENILKEFFNKSYYCHNVYSFTFKFYHPIKNADLGNAIYSIYKSCLEKYASCSKKYASKNCCCDCCDICNIM